MGRPRPRQESVHAQAGMGEKVWACPDRHMQVGAGRYGWVHAGYNHEHKQKEKKKKHLSTGTGRQVGIGKSGHRVRKHRHAQTGTCRWVQGGVWRQEWAQGEKHGHSQTGTCGWAQGGVWRHG